MTDRSSAVGGSLLRQGAQEDSLSDYSADERALCNSLMEATRRIYDIAQGLGRGKHLNASFDCGYLMAAIEIIEGGFIGSDYPPMKAEHERRCMERLTNALAAAGSPPSPPESEK